MPRRVGSAPSCTRRLQVDRSGGREDKRQPRTSGSVMRLDGHEHSTDGRAYQAYGLLAGQVGKEGKKSSRRIQNRSKIAIFGLGENRFKVACQAISPTLLPRPDEEVLSRRSPSTD